MKATTLKATLVPTHVWIPAKEFDDIELAMELIAKELTELKHPYIKKGKGKEVEDETQSRPHHS